MGGYRKPACAFRPEGGCGRRPDSVLEQPRWPPPSAQRIRVAIELVLEEEMTEALGTGPLRRQRDPNLETEYVVEQPMELAGGVFWDAS